MPRCCAFLHYAWFVVGALAPVSAQILMPTPPANPAPTDWRDIQFGHVIPDEEYVDQPYVIRGDDGAWLCTLTTSQGGEGAQSSHVVSTRSTDQGRTWSPLLPLEPQTPPESAYSTLVKTPTGRIYAFYDHNSDNVREIPGPGGKPVRRVDSLGHFVFKFTEDGGRTWSARHYEISIRETEIDRSNVTGGRVRFFWHVGRPLVLGRSVFVPFAKMVGISNQSRSEAFFLRSDNLLTEPDPEKITWTTLPDGDAGLRAPSGIIAEEPSLVSLSDGSLYCTYRTAAGYAAAAYSRDGGHTWSSPAYMTYTPGGQPVKHTRAANFVWRAANGHYLYWYHNNSVGDFTGQRNPAWVAGGREVDGPAGRMLEWSQPEVLLYAAGLDTRISYPDFIEENGRYFITETQKTIARVHEVPAAFLAQLWDQFDARAVTRRGLVVAAHGAASAAGSTMKLPAVFDLESSATDGGLSVDTWVRFDDLAAGQTLLDARDAAGTGWALRTTERGTVELSLRGSFGPPGRDALVLADANWDCDPGLLQPKTWQHVVVIVDGGAKLVRFVVDGRLCDGGNARPYGWARLPRDLRCVRTPKILRVAPALHGELGGVRVYDRRLSTSEAVGNFRAGRAE